MLSEILASPTTDVSTLLATPNCCS